MKTGNDTKMIKRDQNVYSILTANDRKNFLTRLTRSRIFKEVGKKLTNGSKNGSKLGQNGCKMGLMGQKWVKNGLLGFGPKPLVHFGLGSMVLGPRLWVWFGSGLTQNVRWAGFSSF